MIPIQAITGGKVEGNRYRFVPQDADPGEDGRRLLQALLRSVPGVPGMGDEEHAAAVSTLVKAGFLAVWFTFDNFEQPDGGVSVEWQMTHPDGSPVEQTSPMSRRDRRAAQSANRRGLRR